jgi:hypothetical protein
MELEWGGIVCSVNVGVEKFEEFSKRGAICSHSPIAKKSIEMP